MPRLVNASEYLACLPADWQQQTTVTPESDWWTWRDMDLHIARARHPQARARLLILHGAGGHSGALWPAAAIAANLGYEVLAPDLPGYGQTKAPQPEAVRYPDWVDCITDLIRHENSKDARPLVVLGASMGGMLGYAASARAGGVAHLMATCFLDPSHPITWPALSRWGGAVSLRLLRPLLKPLARPDTQGLANLRIPIRWIAPMNRIANHPQLNRLCQEDARGGGSRIPLGFLASFLFSTPEVAPENFRDIPVTLVHPTDDRWTPTAMSLAFFDRIAAPKWHVPLENCGHFPVEEPGLSALANHLQGILDTL